VPFRRLAAGVLTLAIAATVAGVLAGRDDEPPPPRHTPTPTATPTPTPTATPPPTPAPVLDAPAAGPSLALGITEFNANLVASPESRSVPPQWTRWRDELARIRPTVFRLVVPWSSVQPSAAAPPNLALASGGCMRDKGPCAAFAGLRDQLRAMASRGWQGMVVFTGMPAWAAARTPGCRRGATPTGAGPLPAALPAYRQLIADVLALARAEGADVRYVSPWNEPNHSYFLAPQRASCDGAAPSLAVPAYARLARAAAAELAAQPGEVELILGETAGLLERTSRGTAVPEMIAGLPRRLVCGTTVWSQHAYIGGTDPVAAVTGALDARRCPRPHAVWITETGVGPAPGGLSLARGITSQRQGCRLLHRRLVDWYENPRVTLAVQYTFREDDQFPTGLVTTDLARARPALREWQAWGARPSPTAHPPRPTC
jgi:hypothetical protein